MSDAGDLSNDPISEAELAAGEPKPRRAADQPRDEHGHFARKDGSSGRSPRRTKRGSAARSGELSDDDLRALLTGTMRNSAAFVALPTASLVWEQRAPDAVENMIALARKFPSLRVGLETGVWIFAGLGLVNYASAVAFAASCDLGFADPNSIAAHSLGITELYYQAHPDEEEELDLRGDESASPRADEGDGAARRRRLPEPSILGGVRADAP